MNVECSLADAHSSLGAEISYSLVFHSLGIPQSYCSMPSALANAEAPSKQGVRCDWQIGSNIFLFRVDSGLAQSSLLLSRINTPYTTGILALRVVGTCLFCAVLVGLLFVPAFGGAFPPEARDAPTNFQMRVCAVLLLISGSEPRMPEVRCCCWRGGVWCV
jgi:hypothetical protein